MSRSPQHAGALRERLLRLILWHLRRGGSLERIRTVLLDAENRMRGKYNDHDAATGVAFVERLLSRAREDHLGADGLRDLVAGYVRRRRRALR